MTPIANAMATENWAKTSRELISQTRRWAVTMRGITLGPWKGFIENNDYLDENSRPWVDMVSAAHDRWLDLWENQAKSLIDNSLKVTDTSK